MTKTVAEKKLLKHCLDNNNHDRYISNLSWLFFYQNWLIYSIMYQIYHGKHFHLWTYFKCSDVCCTFSNITLTYFCIILIGFYISFIYNKLILHVIILIYNNPMIAFVSLSCYIGKAIKTSVSHWKQTQRHIPT